MMSGGGRLGGGVPTHIRPTPHQRGMLSDAGMLQGGRQPYPSPHTHNKLQDARRVSRPVYEGNYDRQECAHGGGPITDQQLSPPGGQGCLGDSTPDTTASGRSIVDV